MTGDSLSEQAQKMKSRLALVRQGQRGLAEARPCEIITGFTDNPEGSVLIKSGRTQVICTASLEDRVPPFRRGMGQGWVTAEYAMLPRATHTRASREVTLGKVGGRTAEIQRLMGAPCVPRWI